MPGNDDLLPLDRYVHQIEEFRQSMDASDFVEPRTPALALANGRCGSNWSAKNIRLLHILSSLTAVFTLVSAILIPFASAVGKPRM
jgi:hypothetical protein